MNSPHPLTLLSESHSGECPGPVLMSKRTFGTVTKKTGAGCHQDGLKLKERDGVNS